MREFRHVVDDINGLHARPAGVLAALCKGFDSEIKVFALGKEADGKRLLSLMSLGAKQGTELCFKINGKDEEVAEASIKEHFNSGVNNG